MKRITKLLPLVIFLFSIHSTFAQTRDSIRIDALEKAVHGMQDSIFKMQSQQGDILTLLHKFEEFWEKPASTIFSSLAVPALISFLLVWLFIFSLKKLSPSWYTILIQRLIEKYEAVNVLKREKRILLIQFSKDESDSVRFVDKLMKEFNVVEKISIENAFVQPQKSFDIVFANFETTFDKSKHQPILHQYINSVPFADANLFALVPTAAWDYNLDKTLNKRIAIANVRSQVYGNLISMLKYHDLTTPKL